MKLNTIKPLFALLSLMLLVGAFPIFHAKAVARPNIYVSPPENIYYTDETPVGTTFNVSVMAADWVAPGIFSYQFELNYDPTMLEAVAGVIPVGHWLTPSSPANIFVVDPGTINKEAGFVSFGVTLLGTEAGKTGGGLIATITLKIIASPPTGGSLTCPLEIKNQLLVDPTATEIPSGNYDVIAGMFKYAAPPPPWYLKVEPALIAASVVGEKVSIDIKIYEAKAEAAIVGVQFKLIFPEILTTIPEMISEGPFFEAVGETFFAAFVESDEAGNTFAIAFTFLLPAEEGTWSSFPAGNGVLATITFDVVSLPETLTTYPLTLTEVIIVDSQSNTLPYRRLESGAIMAPAKPEDLNVDGRVDIQDMAMFAIAFGSNPLHERWNSKADINHDGKVNILDGVLIAKSFGFKA